MNSTRLVIIPTYKEKENIAAMIEKVMRLAVPFDLLVVDDNSPDGTAAIVKSYMQSYPNQLFILERSGKLGLGTAYIAGFKWALERNYNSIFEMDCDFSHNPDDLIRLSEALELGADLVVGSRYFTGVNVVNWPIGRVILSYYASVYVRFITGLPVKDATAGFVGYKANVLKSINLNKIKFIGYAFQIEMKFKSWKKGFKIQEVPIIFTDRKEGQSKLSSGIISEAIFGVLKLKIQSWFTKH